MTIEEIISAMERGGWRMSNLSFIGNAKAYSCILERKKPARDGGSIFAFNDKKLHATPLEAVADAWRHAKEAPNDRVVKQPEPDKERRAWVALEYALMDHMKALGGEVEEDDDFL